MGCRNSSKTLGVERALDLCQLRLIFGRQRRQHEAPLEFRGETGEYGSQPHLQGFGRSRVHDLRVDAQRTAPLTAPCISRTGMATA